MRRWTASDLNARLRVDFNHKQDALIESALQQIGISAVGCFTKGVGNRLRQRLAEKLQGIE